MLRIRGPDPSGGLLDHRLRRIPEADRQTVIGIHQADRDRQIDQFPLLEHGARGLVCFIRHAGLGDARHRFGPGKRGTLTLVEEIAGFRPRLHQRELLDLLSFLERSRVCMSRQ